MKKVVLLIFSFLVFTGVCSALEEEEIFREKVTLINCINSTTSWVNINNKNVRIRLLAIDPSIEDTTEVDEYVCNILNKANTLEIERDVDLTDKYNRELVWLYVDGILLQEKIIKEGYGQVNYITNNYKYLDNLCELQKNAIIRRKGIWNDDSIEEAYCASGIERKKESVKEEIVKKEEDNLDIKELKHVIFLSSGILLIVLMLLLIRKNEKR